MTRGRDGEGGEGGEGQKKVKGKKKEVSGRQINFNSYVFTRSDHGLYVRTHLIK